MNTTMNMYVLKCAILLTATCFSDAPETESICERGTLCYLCSRPNWDGALVDTYLEGLSASKEVNLTNCNIRSLEAAPFKALRSTKNMILSGNKLQTLSKRMLEGLANVLVLNLNSNEIRDIQPGTFQNMANLEVLDLSQNQLQHIGHNYFLSLLNVQYIDIQRNRVSFVNMTHFSTLTSLRYLRFARNEINKTFGLSDLPLSLRWLDLAHNNLQMLPNINYCNFSLTMEGNHIYCGCYDKKSESIFSSSCKAHFSCASTSDFKGSAISTVSSSAEEHGLYVPIVNIVSSQHLMFFKRFKERTICSKPTVVLKFENDKVTCSALSNPASNLKLAISSKIVAYQFPTDLYENVTLVSTPIRKASTDYSCLAENALGQAIETKTYSSKTKYVQGSPVITKSIENLTTVVGPTKELSYVASDTLTSIEKLHRQHMFWVGIGAALPSLILVILLIIFLIRRCRKMCGQLRYRKRLPRRPLPLVPPSGLAQMESNSGISARHSTHIYEDVIGKAVTYGERLRHTTSAPSLLELQGETLEGDGSVLPLLGNCCKCIELDPRRVRQTIAVDENMSRGDFQYLDPISYTEPTGPTSGREAPNQDVDYEETCL